MAKKNFGGLDSLLKKTEKTPEKKAETTPTPKKKTTKPKESKQPVKSTKIGTKAGEARATFIINEELHETLKAIAYWERKSIKDVMFEAMSQYIESIDKATITKATKLYKKNKG